MSNFSVTTERSGRRTFGEHDDRWFGDGGSNKGYGGRGGKFRGNRGKKFTNSRGNKGYRGRGRGYSSGRANYSKGYQGRKGGGGAGPLSRYEDDDGDFSMENDAASSSASRYSPYGSRPDKGPRSSRGRGRNSAFNNDQMNRMGLSVKGHNSSWQKWYKVKIPKAKAAGEDYIKQTIMKHLQDPFMPTNFHFEQETAVFYIKDERVVAGLKELTKTIPLQGGCKMIFIIRPENAPILSDEDVEKLKVVMSNRYDPSTKALNMSDIYADQSLKSENIQIVLTRQSAMSAVIKIIKENIPELECIDMSDNRITYLEEFGKLAAHTPNMKSVNLSKNKIRNIEELMKIKEWSLEELNLDGNDFCDKYKDQSSYISAVRKKFPKVIKLDGHVLPPPITFDLDIKSELPQSKGSFFVNDEVQSMIVKFLKEFFTLYDSDNRQQLIDAYHDEALFSMNAAYNQSIEFNQPKLVDYIAESRNMLIVKDSAKRNKLLKRGRLNVVSQLTQLPKTTHDYNSFLVDVDHCSNKLLSFSVEGVFKEVESKYDRPPVRFFSRRFITVPQGAGMVISNDMLTVSNASREQYQKAFKHPAPTPSSSPVPGASPAMPFSAAQSDPAAVQAGPAYTEIQQQMIIKFSEQSGMNNQWSINCLEQNGWDYEKSGQVFLGLQAENKIPPEAFVK